jgi:hypothetical protein
VSCEQAGYNSKVLKFVNLAIVQKLKNL